MGKLNEKTRDELEHFVSELTTMRDQVRLKLHLASMDVKEKYAKLDEEIFELQQRAKRVTAETAAEVKERLGHVRSRLEQLKDDIV